jgi:hypothetical protein
MEGVFKSSPECPFGRGIVGVGRHGIQAVGRLNGGPCQLWGTLESYAKRKIAAGGVTFYGADAVIVGDPAGNALVFA